VVTIVFWVVIRALRCGSQRDLSGSCCIAMSLLRYSWWLPSHYHVVYKVNFDCWCVPMWSLGFSVQLPGCCHMVSNVLFALGGCQGVTIRCTLWLV